MVGATLALSLIGLGAVSALPAKPVEQRQTFVIGAPGEGGTVEWGSGIPNCSPSIPAGVPCISQPFSGGFKIPKEKREEEDVEKRQSFVIGPPGEGGSIGFGEGLPQCSPSLPVNVPCVSPPITGGFKIPKEKREEDSNIKARQTIVIGPPSEGGTIEFGGGLPPCSKSLPVNVPCISIPTGGGFKIPKEKREEEESKIEERQTFVIGPPIGGPGAIEIGKGLPPCSKSLPVNTPCLTVPPSGGFRIPKEKREVEVEESNAVLTPRQEIITIGRDVCTQTEILALMYAFTQIVLPYGTPNKAPPYIQSIARDIIESLRLCGLNVGGWTTIPGGPLVPQPTVPGGPLTPNPTVPGGPLKPDPVNPGSGGALKPEPVQPGNPITPDPTVPGGPLRPPKRSVETDNEKGAAALLASLRELEKVFGSYGSPNIPPQIYGLMVEHVLALQKLPGVVVTGWPVLKQDLGGGTVTLTP